MARLVLLSEGFTGRTYELKVDKTTIGRVEDNAFEIPDASISGHHCEVVLRGQDVVVKDLDSTNGTFVDGQKVSETVVKHGQILKLGTIEMRVETRDTPAPNKQVLDNTRIIGVKRDQLEGARPPVFDTGTGFSKKNTKASLMFLIGAGIVGVILLVLLFLVIIQNKGQP